MFNLGTWYFRRCNVLYLYILLQTLSSRDIGLPIPLNKIARVVGYLPALVVGYLPALVVGYLPALVVGYLPALGMRVYPSLM